MKRIIFYFSFLVIPAFATGQEPVYQLMKGRALIDAGKNDEAIAVLSGPVNESRNADFFLLRAEAYLAKGDYSSAINDFTSANNMKPSSGEFGLARVYAIRNDAATAVYHLELSMKSEFRKKEKEILPDPAFSRLENRPEWRQFWRKDWYSTPEKGLAEIEYNISTSNIQEAKNVLRTLSSGYPGNEYVLYASALVGVSESKFPEAIKTITGLLNEHPDNVQYIQLLATAQEASGNPAGASLSYSRLIDLMVPDPELLWLRAGCYRKTGETRKALQDLDKYLEFYPGNKKALSFAGKTASAGGDNIKALAYFSENVRLHPNDAECYVDRANAYFLARSWNWAAQDYGMSLDLQPGNSDAWLNMGISLVNLGKEDDACFYFRRSFNLGNKKAVEYLSRHCIK